MYNFKLKTSIVTLAFSILFFGILVHKAYINTIKNNEIEVVPVIANLNCEIIKQSDKNSGIIIANQDKLIYKHAKGEGEKHNANNSKKDAIKQIYDTNSNKSDEHEAIMRILEEKKQLAGKNNQNSSKIPGVNGEEAPLSKLDNKKPAINDGSLLLKRHDDIASKQLDSNNDGITGVFDNIPEEIQYEEVE